MLAHSPSNLTLLSTDDSETIVKVTVTPIYGVGQKPEGKVMVLRNIDDFLAGKILDSLGVPHALFTRWGTDNQEM